MRLFSDGDVALYNSDGAAAKFYWDSSEAALSVGSTTNNSGAISATIGTGNYAYRMYRTDGQEVGGLYNATNGAGLFLKDSSGNSDVVLSSYGDSYFLAGNVGIGVSSVTNPSSRTALQIGGGSNGGGVYMGTNTTDTENARVVSDSGGSIYIATATTGTNTVGFFTANTERARIDSSGRFMVGITSANGVDGVTLNGSGYVYGNRDGGVSGYFDRGTSDGDIVEFRKNGSQIGTIGVDNTDNLTVAGNANHAGLMFGTDGVLPYKNGALRNGTEDLGSAAHRWRDIIISGGIYLGGTTSPHKLDDYEEGTWTATINVNGFSQTVSSISNEEYTKIGNVVRCRCTINLSSSGYASSYSQILGLPFSTNGASALGRFTGGSIGAGGNGGAVYVSGTTVYLFETFGSTSSAAWTTGWNLDFTYITAS